MKHLALGLSFALAGCAALAAPVPPPKEALYFNQRGWGKPIDPDGDCRFVKDRAALSIEVPGKPHELDPSARRTNAPRLLREVTGNFDALVRVHAVWHPTPWPSAPRLESRVSAGLVLVAEGEAPAVLRFAYGARYDTAGVWGLIEFTSAAEKSPAGRWAGRGSEQSWSGRVESTAYLRLERHGDRVTGRHSSDGRAWREYADPAHSDPAPLPEKLKIGVVVCSTSRSRVSVTFDWFHVTPLDDAGRPRGKE